MRWKTTVVLLVTTVAIGVYVSQVELKRPTQERQVQLQRQVLQIPSDQATALMVKFPEAPVTLARTHDIWRLTAPLSARAENTLVRRILSALDPLMAQGALESTPDKPLKLAEFGLEPPAGVLIVTTPTQTVELQFGAQTVIGKSYYVKRGDAATVFIIPSELYDALHQSIELYRSHELLDVNTASVNTLTVASATSSYTLTKHDQTWQLTAPFADAADSAMVSTLLSRVRQLYIERFISDSPQSAQFSEWGLDAPAPFAKITIGFSESDHPPIELLVGNPTSGSAAHCYAKRSDEPSVYSVAKTDIQELLKDPQELRSHTVFEIFANEVTKLRLTSPQQTWTVEFKDGKWVTANDSAALEASKVEAFVWRLRDTKLTRVAEDHPKNLKSYGLEPAHDTIEVWVKTSADPKRLSVGSVVPQQTTRYGLIAGRPAVVELPETMTAILTTTLDSFKTAPAAASPTTSPPASPPTPSSAPASAN